MPALACRTRTEQWPTKSHTFVAVNSNMGCTTWLPAIRQPLSLLTFLAGPSSTSMASPPRLPPAPSAGAARCAASSCCR